MKLSKTKIQAFSYLNNYKLIVVLLMTLILVYTFLTSLSPVIYGKMFDKITNPEMDKFITLLVIYSILLFFTAILNFLVSYSTEYFGNIIFKESQHALFAKILSLKISNFDNFTIGELMTNLESDLETIISFDINFLSAFVTILLNSVVPFAFMVYISSELTILALLFIPVTFIIYFCFKNRKKQLHEELQKNQEKLYSFTVNTIENTSGLKSYRLESISSNKYHQLVTNIFHSENKLNFITGIVNMSNEWNNLVYMFFSLLLYYYLLKKGVITLGVMVSFGMYVNKLFTSISMLQTVQLDEQSVFIALQRIDRVSKLESELTIDLDTEPDSFISSSSVSLKISNISFHYENTDDILHNFSISLEKPGLYSVVGENGSGKTTLYKLLVKFYDYQYGSILLNDVDYKSCTVSNLRKHVTYVQKIPFIFEDTLFNNITLYQSVSEEQISHYCKVAGLNNLISTLPDGLHSTISSESLSSGQRQKIGFARALAHQTDVMLFDEITSDLDGNAELSFVQVMKKLSKERIVLSISHRAQTILESDKIFVINNGQIIESGTYNELIQPDTYFSTLFYSLES